MSNTVTQPPETSQEPPRRALFTMNDILVSASKENPELFGSASGRGQPSHRETYNHSGFTARQSLATPNPFRASGYSNGHHRLTAFYKAHNDLLTAPTSNFTDTDHLESVVSSEPDTPTHQPTHQYHNEDPDSPNGSTLANLVALAAPANLVVLEGPVAPVVLKVPVVSEDPQTSKSSYGNS